MEFTIIFLPLLGAIISGFFGKWFVFDKNTKKSMDIIYDLESMTIDTFWFSKLRL